MSFYPRIVTIQSAKGGVGCSVIAANTALGMVYETKKPVCLIEFVCTLVRINWWLLVITINVWKCFLYKAAKINKG
ncbi:MAG: hypothetical protein ACK4IX_01605, partial [Candidatus Sericytochromatia bacterium]